VIAQQSGRRQAARADRGSNAPSSEHRDAELGAGARRLAGLRFDGPLAHGYCLSPIAYDGAILAKTAGDGRGSPTPRPPARRERGVPSWTSDHAAADPHLFALSVPAGTRRRSGRRRDRLHFHDAVTDAAVTIPPLRALADRGRHLPSRLAGVARGRAGAARARSRCAPGRWRRAHDRHVRGRRRCPGSCPARDRADPGELPPKTGETLAHLPLLPGVTAPQLV